MVYYCCVALCQNSGAAKRSRGNDLNFHRFPTDPELCRIWKEKCNRKDDFSTHSGRICSDHFNEDDYERNLKAELLGLTPRKRLKEGAVPSKFPFQIPSEPPAKSPTCFICLQPVTDLSRMVDLQEGRVLEYLCELFDTPWVQKLQFCDLKNSEFCANCVVLIEESLKLLEERKILQVRLEYLRTTLQNALITTHFNSEFNSSTGQKSDLGPSDRLRKLLVQCWTEPKVVVPKIAVNVKQEVEYPDSGNFEEAQSPSFQPQEEDDFIENFDQETFETQEERDPLYIPDPDDEEAESEYKPNQLVVPKATSKPMKLTEESDTETAAETTEPQCDVCKLTFENRVKLIMHRKSQHGIAPAEQMTCKHCGLNLSTCRVVVDATTEEFHCTSCPKVFPSAASLRIHHSAKCRRPKGMFSFQL